MLAQEQETYKESFGFTEALFLFILVVSANELKSLADSYYKKKGRAFFTPQSFPKYAALVTVLKNEEVKTLMTGIFYLAT